MVRLLIPPADIPPANISPVDIAIVEGARRDHIFLTLAARAAGVFA